MHWIKIACLSSCVILGFVTAAIGSEGAYSFFAAALVLLGTEE